MIEYVLVAAGYLGGMGVTIQLREKLLEPPKRMYEFERKIAHFFTGLAWPVYLPPFLAYQAANKGLPKITLPSLPKKAEIAPGIPCPLDVLAQMAKASLLKDFKVEYEHIKNAKVDLYVFRRGPYSTQPEIIYEVKLRIGDKKFSEEDFSNELCADLHKFYKQMLQTDEERIRAEELTARRNKALDGIESLLTIEEENG